MFCGIHVYTAHKRKILVLSIFCILAFMAEIGRLAYLGIARQEYYSQQAQRLHERERKIKAARGKIYDRNGVLLASNRSVCTISVIHSQIEDKELVITKLCSVLGLSEEYVRGRVEKVSAIEKIGSNFPREVGETIRELELSGVKVDEDYKRVYPYGRLASKVLGFTGADNQGIIGIEVEYEECLGGTDGLILATADAWGTEIDDIGEGRLEPIAGNDLYLTLDYRAQRYATQLAEQVMESKDAEHVSILVMNPQNGDIYAMVDVPEFDLNAPFEKEEGEELNQIWRNSCISDTYEPGSTFKIITAAAALEEKMVSVDEGFYCPGYCVVEDRKIRCHKTAGHGSETFMQGIMNSCNPVFITIGLRLGAEKFCSYFDKFGLMRPTGIDLPGEARTIMHKAENMGPVEVATVSFGQSFQITPLQMATTAASIVNGGIRVVPHIAAWSEDAETGEITTYGPLQEGRILSEETSDTMQMLLEQVVENGTGKNAYVEGFRIGGKTATSQTLPRGSGRYIASFLGFAPADRPTVLALIVITAPQGAYYGGQVAAPAAHTLFENILPYLE